jgi:hypothetical protein
LVLSNLLASCYDVIFLATFLFFFSTATLLPMTFIVVGTCLDFIGEARHISEWIAALERSSEGVETFWSDPQCRSLLFFSKIALNTLEKQLMVVENL